MEIHPTAIVSEKAVLAEDTAIGPYAIIEEDVKIGRRVKIHSHAQILKHTAIGDDCQIYMGAILGGLPQVRARFSLNGRLIIGQRNIFREYSTVHRSSEEASKTIIGDDNYLMAFSHIAHDCTLSNHITICNGTLIAGHVYIEDDAVISGNVTVHQFCRLGRLAMIGGLARIAKDVPPYMLVKGESGVWAINSVGLKRAHLSLRARTEIKRAFKLLYLSGLNVHQALEKLAKEQTCLEVQHLINFIRHSQRGICGYKKTPFWKRFSPKATLSSYLGLPAYNLFQKRQKYSLKPNE